jgi:hypothetical protein
LGPGRIRRIAARISWLAGSIGREAKHATDTFAGKHGVLVLFRVFRSDEQTMRSSSIRVRWTAPPRVSSFLRSLSPVPRGQ